MRVSSSSTRRRSSVLTVVSAAAAAAGVIVGLAACGDDGPAATDAPASSAPGTSTVTTTGSPMASPPDTSPVASTGAPGTSPSAPSTTSPGEITHPALRDELLEMFRVDQDERTGVLATNSDREHAERLDAIVAEHGWPTRTMVGEDGATAAWTIAQHADFDVDFQARMLRLLSDAVQAGEASAGDMAYLTDRVAVNRDRPQTYGTQIGGCGPNGAEPGRIRDMAGVDERRAQAGLPPLADYLAEFAEMCSESG